MASAESSPCLPTDHSYFAFEKSSSSSPVSASPHARHNNSTTAASSSGSVNSPSSATGFSSKTVRPTPTPPQSISKAKKKFDQKPLPSLPSLPPVPQIKITVSPPASPFNSIDLQKAMAKLPHHFNSASHLNSKFTNCTGMDITPISSADQFSSVACSGDENFDVVILDLRPFKQYNVSRVKGALSICVPTTLLKRSSFHLSNIFKTMVGSQEKILQSKLESHKDLRVIFYDSTSDIRHCSLHLHQIIKKFRDSMADYEKGISLYIVDRGFAMFEDADGSSSSSMLIDHTKFKSSSLQESNNAMTGFSNFVLPSADPASAFIMALKNNSAFPDTKGTTLRAPAFGNAEDLPKWLQRYAQSDAVNTVISNFVTIESMENARIGASVQRRASSISNAVRSSPGATSSPGDNIQLNGSEYGFKNRYPNILPYEHSRVRLVPSPMSASTTPGLSGGGQLYVRAPSVSPNSGNSSATSTKRPDDYFNANFLSVPQINQDAKYIATQAPLPSTIDDFWKVVWHNKVEVIISLTNLSENGMKKSDIYWQESSQVHLVREEDHFNGVENLTVRTIELTKRGKTRTIRQLHFKCWPDFGVVKYNELLDLISVKDQFLIDNKSPIVVHCSAGCGRTGVFITIDLILEAFKRSQYQKLSDVPPPLEACGIDLWRTDEDLIYYTVQQLRKQRISMVQSLDQFVFCYETILQHFSGLQSKE